ncbi:MAG: hypothetical protein CMH52_05075 [Myxococcales bacterium]|nr:hypothetical protein [Myxococcales bacterium]
MIGIKRPLRRQLLVLLTGLSGLMAMGCSTALEDEQPLDAGPRQLDGLLGQCTPGEERCTDGYRDVCGGNGLWIQTNEAGGCGGIQDSCSANAMRRSYIGCEYWPVDLDNAVEVFPVPPVNGVCDIPGNSNWRYRDDLFVCVLDNRLAGLCDLGRQCPETQVCQQAPACVLDAQNSNFSIVISNPSTASAVDVNLMTPDGQALSDVVPPGGVTRLEPYRAGVLDASIDGSGITRSAYRLTSTGPIVAYQFNPLDNDGVFSNDGSLLLPSHALDSVYLALTLPTIERRPYGHPYSGYLTVVATDSGQTDIQVTPSADIRAGIRQASYAARMEHSFSLQQGDVLNLEAADRGDLTGTRIAARNGKTIAVFVGHESTLLSDRRREGSDDPLCCGDHVEEQLLPISTWGVRFAVARSAEREDQGRGGRVAPDRLRLLASNGDTRIEFSPTPVSGQCGALVAGDYCDVYIQNDTEIISNHPILVGQMLLSTDGQTGDPALAFVPPVAQWRSDYTFLVPNEYRLQYASIVSYEGGPVELNGRDVSTSLYDFGDGLRAGRIELLESGRFILNCPQRCGLMVMGYDEAVSYMFAGGLDLEPVRLQ